MNTEWWRRFINFDDEVEIRRKTFVITTLSYLGAAIMLGFALLHMDEDLPLRPLLFSGTAIFLLNIFYFHWRGKLELSCYVGCFCICIFVLALVKNGGHMGTALYWVYPFPAIIPVLLGPRLGALVNLSLFTGLALLLYAADFSYQGYSPEAKSRFLASLFTLILLSFFVEYFRSLSHREMAKINYEKQRLANTDALTSLPNRRFLDHVYLERAMASALEYFPMTVVVADIDHFKNVNDTYGHATGDRVLVHIADKLKQHVRASDVVARTGGEEFIILYAKTPYELGCKLAEKLRDHIARESVHEHGTDISVTMSFGVSTAKSDAELYQTIRNADRRLYAAKASGRNCVK